MGKLDYRVKYEYPLRPGQTKPSKSTIMKGEEVGADNEAKMIAQRGGTAQVWHVHHETGVRTHLRTYSPAGVPDEQYGEDDRENEVLSDEEVAQRQVAAPAPAVTPGTEHLKTGEVYSYTATTGATRPVRLLDRRMWRQLYKRCEGKPDDWRDVTGPDVQARETVNGATGVPVLRGPELMSGEAAVDLVEIGIADLPLDEHEAAEILQEWGTYTRPDFSMRLVDPARIGPTWADYCKAQAPEPTVAEPEPVKRAPTIDDVSEALRHLGIRGVNIQLSDGEPRFVLPMSDMVKVLGHLPKELW